MTYNTKSNGEGQKNARVELKNAREEWHEKYNKITNKIKNNLGCELEGFLEIEPNKGATVKDLTQKDIAQMYDIIGVLEGLSIRVATPKISDKDIGRIENLVLEMERNRKDQFKLFRINREFHELLTELGGNDRLIAIMNGTRSNMERMGLQSFYNQDQIKATLKEHREILDAIKERKAWRVENLIRKHYMTARDRLIKAINNTL